MAGSMPQTSSRKSNGLEAIVVTHGKAAPLAESLGPPRGQHVGLTNVVREAPLKVSGLKTLLETGETLTTPGSLMYSAGEPAA
jgi:hypothetical protein